MRYFWLTVIALSVIPAGVAALFLNPLVFLALGPDAWREQLRRLHPFRWWILSSVLALALSTTVYAAQYA
jgi:hypothetical protein